MRALILAMVLALTAVVTHAQEPRIQVIDGVEYRLFNAEEMRDILGKLNERRILQAENAILHTQLDTAVRKFDEAQANRDEAIRLATARFEGERNYWKDQFEAERSNSSRLTAIFKSCTGKILGVFRICRL